MKKTVILVVFVLFCANLSLSQNNASQRSIKSELIGFKSKDFLQLTFQSGFINPVSPVFNDYYYTSLNMGLDLSYRVNTEVAIYGEIRNNFLTAKDTTSPSSTYFESTVGARYYVRLGSGRSSLFFESGFGPYIFIGGGSTIPNQLYDTQTKIRLGGNVGLGGEFVITNSVFFTLKSKINSVFDPKGSTTYLSGVGGISIRL